MVEDKNQISLREYFDTLRKADLDSIKATINKAEENNEKRFQAQEAAVKTAFEASKEAILKSEVGVEKRADAVYVTIGKLSESLVAVMPRAEAVQRFDSLAEKIEGLKTSRDNTDGRASGFDKSWAYLVAAITAVAAVVTIVTILAR